MAVSRSRRFCLTIGVLALNAVSLHGALAADAKPLSSLDFARGLIEAEQFQQAVGVLKDLNSEDAATSAQIDLLTGRIYLAIGKPAKALGYFEDASFATLDGEAEAYLGLAEANLALGDLDKARRNASLALKSDADLTAAHLVLARVDQRIGRTAEAATRLRELRRNQPDSVDAAVVFARFRTDQDGPAAGISELQAFLGSYPLSASAQDALGQLLWSVGRKAEAIEARTVAQRLYHEHGQTGRAAAMAAWLKAVHPQWNEKNDSVDADGQVLKPRNQSPSEPPPPKASPRPTVKATPLAAAPSAQAAQFSALANPEPLPFGPNTPIMTGSGLVLEGGRQILTNRHVVEGASAIAVRNGTGHLRNARVAKTSTDDDLALLEIDKPFPEAAVMPLADIIEPAPGRPAIVMGYPMITILGDQQPALTEGVIAKSVGLENDPNTFQMTAKINKGSSGSPVFDRRGHLLGVAVGKTDTAALFQKSGVLMEDMNFGIKGGRILRFLGKSSISETDKPEMALEDLYREMLPRAVLVVAAQK